MLEGVKEIAAAAEVGASTILRWARLPVDPLPCLAKNGGSGSGFVLVISEAKLQGFLRRMRARASGKRDPSLPIASLREGIAAAIGVSPRYVWDLMHDPRHKADPLPVEKGTHLWAYVSALQDWVDRNRLPYQVALALRGRLAGSSDA